MVRTGRVAPYHAAYRDFASITDGQRSSIDELCLLPNDTYICYFCPTSSTDFIPFSDFPLQEDQLYSSAEELYGHVCLYHYPFVHVYQCGYCSNTVAVFPTWSQMANHFHKIHDGLWLHGRQHTSEALVEDLATPRGRALHPGGGKVLYNEKFIPPRRLPRSFPKRTVARQLHAYAWGPWTITLKAVQCVPDLYHYSTRFLIFDKEFQVFGLAYTSI